MAIKQGHTSLYCYPENVSNASAFMRATPSGKNWICTWKYEEACVRVCARTHIVAKKAKKWKGTVVKLSRPTLEIRTTALLIVQGMCIRPLSHRHKLKDLKKGMPPPDFGQLLSIETTSNYMFRCIDDQNKASQYEQNWGVWSSGGKIKQKLVPTWHYGNGYRNITGKTKQRVNCMSAVLITIFLLQLLCFKFKPSDMDKLCAAYWYFTPQGLWYSDLWGSKTIRVDMGTICRVVMGKRPSAHKCCCICKQPLF